VSADLPSTVVGTRSVTAILKPRARFALRAAGAIGVLALAFHLAHGQLGLGGGALRDFSDNVVYDGVIVGASISCLVRAWLVRAERLPWLMLGVGLALDATGEIYWSLAFGYSSNPPSPSLADLFYLLYYPAMYVAVVLLVRRRFVRLSASAWLDGAIAAAASAAVIAALALEPILRSAVHGSAAAIATNMAYPLGDLILLAIVVGAAGLSGWRPGRAWALLGLGLALSAIADVAYVYANIDDTYVVGGILDSIWVASALAVGFAAWQPLKRSQEIDLEARRVLAIPAGFALVALGVLLYGGFHHVGAVGLALAASVIVLVIVRAGWTFHENVRLLDSSRREAVTDALTGLGNRRAMNTALARALAGGAASAPAVLALFDLDGFKLYNDRFGHLAGDALLEHLGARLQAAVGTAGRAYRMGGDEFCVLIRAEPEHADVHLAAALAALTVWGEEFNVGCSVGRVAIPSEAHAPTVALHLADDRMYARKNIRPGSARQQSHDVLLGLLRERQPELHEHVRHVGQLAVLVGRRLGLDAEHLDVIRRAADLHDVGKAAIPDAILSKPGPLTDGEWEFMRRHTVIGERILAAAPALAPVAELVRASHERWDGSGYPDRLAGDAIPLGSRIVAVCDAFDAMITDRPYQRAKTPAEAIAELRRVAGSQLDPGVVEAFAEAWEPDEALPLLPPEPAPESRLTAYSRS
jgi:two-component system, cell cycle response regulator